MECEWPVQQVDCVIFTPREKSVWTGFREGGAGQGGASSIFWLFELSLEFVELWTEEETRKKDGKFGIGGFAKSCQAPTPSVSAVLDALLLWFLTLDWTFPTHCRTTVWMLAVI